MAGRLLLASGWSLTGRRRRPSPVATEGMPLGGVAPVVREDRYRPAGHDGGADLAAQVEAARVVAAAAGGLTLSTRSGRGDLLRAASWAVAAQVTSADALPFFVY